MANQSNLEKKGIERRQVELARQDFNKNDEYGPTHDKAKTHDDAEHPWGKGTGHGGHTHYVPDYSKDPHLYDFSNFDTTNGGGSFDKLGRNEQGGRVRLMNINIYDSEHQYGPESVDTTTNLNEGQYRVQ